MMSILTKILNCKDELDQLISSICKKSPSSIVITIIPNIPGMFKKLFPAKGILLQCDLELLSQLKQKEIPVVYYQQYHNKTFYYSILVILLYDNQVSSLTVKEICTSIEEDSPLGRYCDIDVYINDSTKISRSQIGKRERKCYLCSKSAKECSALKSHPVWKLILQIQFRYLKNHFKHKKGCCYESN